MKKLLALLLVCGMILSLGAVGVFAAEGEAETEEPAEAAEETGEEGPELSDDLYSFQLQIGDEIYELPMSYQDFIAAGWKTDADEAEEVEPNSYIWGIEAKIDYLAIDIEVINLGINTTTLSECMVGGISFDEDQFEDAPYAEILFPGGLKYGEATREDLEAAYGAPYDTYEGSDYVELTYRYDSYQTWDFEIDSESGLVTEFEIENFVEDEEANAAAAAEVSSDPTEAVLAYVAPAEMSDDPLEYVFELVGDLYQLPAPVSAFLANGWTLQQEGSEAGRVVMGYDYDYASLMKDGETLSVSINNYDPNAQVVENCFVTDITFYSSDDFGLKLPYEITFEMTGDELVAALDSIPKDILPKYDVDDDSDLATYYTIVDMDDEYQGIKIAVDKEDNTISWLEIEHEPETLS